MSAAFYIKIEQTKSFLFQGRIQHAQMILNELPTESNVESRWKDHYLGIIKMRRGEYAEAISLFQNTLKKNGNYLSVILDLALCYQIIGQIYSWQQMVAIADSEYANIQEKLQLAKRVQVGLLLAKFTEEKGLVSESIEHYEKLLEIDPNNFHVIAQILRVHGQFCIKRDLDTYYQQLCQKSSFQSQLDSDFEFQLALLIYELNTHGAEVALARYQRICQNPLIQSQEINFVKNDLYYELLVRAFRDFKIDTGEQTIFTKAIESILTRSDLQLEHYMDCVTKLTPKAQLRLVKIWSLSSKNILPLKRQKILTEMFSNKTKAIWYNYLGIKINLENVPDEIVLNSADHTARSSYNKKQLRLTKNGFETIELLIDRNEIALKDVFIRLWNSQGNDAELTRLRMRVARLNHIFKLEFGIKSCFQMDKTHLKSKCKITKL